MWTKLLCIALVCISAVIAQECVPSVTRSKSINGTICSRALIFEDNFDTIDMSKWSYEITMAGGGNWEFQIYHYMYGNAFTQNGILHYAPGYTSDYYGSEEFLWTGTIDLGAECTQSDWYGCYREGTTDNYLNPITSTRLHTTGKFSFTYGQVEVRAKMPAGDWLWPAIWMMPQDSIYGGWPTSGEIDINEGRGNRDLISNGQNIGVELAASTMHWGVDWSQNQYGRTHWELNQSPGFDADFHVYRVDWTPDYIAFSIDGGEIGRVTPPAGGFYELGQITGPNPWAGGSKMAPFDADFYLILNLACGGTNGFFPDNIQNPGGKPWSNTSPYAPKEFWNGRGQWEPTWHQDGSTHMEIDYVRVWSL